MIPSGKANNEMEVLMKRHLKFEVMNQVSTLNRITSAFVRLQYNIEELHVKNVTIILIFLIWNLLLILRMKTY